MGSSTSTIKDGWDGSPTQIGSLVFQNNSGVVSSWTVTGTFIPSLSTVSAAPTSSDWLFESLASSMFPSDGEVPTFSEPFASSTGDLGESFIPSVSTFEILELSVTSDVLSVSEIETSVTISSTELEQHGISTRDDFLDYSSAASTSETYVSGSDSVPTQISETLVAKHPSEYSTEIPSSELVHSDILQSSEYYFSSKLETTSTATSDHALSLDTYSLLFSTLSSTEISLSSVSETTHTVSELPFSTSISPESFDSDDFISAFSSQHSAQLSGEGPSKYSSDTSSAFYTSEAVSSITEELSETPVPSSTDELYSASESDIVSGFPSSPETLSAVHSSVDSEAPFEAVTSTLSKGSSFLEYSLLESEYLSEMSSSIEASFIPSESSSVELSTSVKSPTSFELSTPMESSSATELSSRENLSSSIDSSYFVSTSTDVQIASSVEYTASVESSFPFSSSTEESSGFMDSSSVEIPGTVELSSQFGASTYEYSSASEKISTDASTHETDFISESLSVTEQWPSSETGEASRVSSGAYPSDILSSPDSSTVQESLVVSELSLSSDLTTISDSTSPESSIPSESMSSDPDPSTTEIISSFAPQSSTVSGMSSSVLEIMSSAPDISVSSNNLVPDISSADFETSSSVLEVASSVLKVSSTAPEVSSSFPESSASPELSSSAPESSSVPYISSYSGLPSSTEISSIPEVSSFLENSSFSQGSSDAEYSSTTDHSSALKSSLSSEFSSVEKLTTSMASYISELPSVSDAISDSQMLESESSIVLGYSSGESSSSFMPDSEKSSATDISSAQQVSSVSDIGSEYPPESYLSISDAYSESDSHFETTSASQTADLPFTGSTSDSILASSFVPEYSLASKDSASHSSIPGYSSLESSELESLASVTLTYSSDLSTFEASSVAEYPSIRSSSVDSTSFESSASETATEVSSVMESSSVIKSSSPPEITSATLSSTGEYSSVLDFSSAQESLAQELLARESLAQESLASEASVLRVSSVPELSSIYESRFTQESSVPSQSSLPEDSESSYEDSESTWSQMKSSYLGTTSISDDSPVSETVSAPYFKSAESSFDYSRSADAIATETEYSKSESSTALVTSDSTFLSFLPYSESSVVPTSSNGFVSSYTDESYSLDGSSKPSETGFHSNFDFSALSSSYISDGTKEVETPTPTFSLGYESTSMEARSSSFDFSSAVTEISEVPQDSHIKSESTSSSWVSLVLSGSLYYAESGASFTEPALSETLATSIIQASQILEDLSSSLFSELPKSSYSEPLISRGSDTVYPTSLAGRPFTSSEPSESESVFESAAESDLSSFTSSEPILSSFESDFPIASSDGFEHDKSSFVVSSIMDTFTGDTPSLSAEPTSSFELSSTELSFPFASQTLKSSLAESFKTDFKSGGSSSFGKETETSDLEVSVSKTISSEASDSEIVIVETSAYETSASGTLAHGSPSYEISSEDPWSHKTSAVETSAYETSHSDASYPETPSQRPGEFETYGTSSEFVGASVSSSGLLQSETSIPEASDDTTSLSETLTLVSESSPYEVSSFSAESGTFYSSSYSDDSFTSVGSSWTPRLPLSLEQGSVATSTGVSKSKESGQSSSLIDQSVAESKTTDDFDASATGEAVSPTSDDLSLASASEFSDFVSSSSDVPLSTASSDETASLDYSVNKESKTSTDTDVSTDTDIPTGTTTSDIAATSGPVTDLDSVSLNDSTKMTLLTTTSAPVSEYGMEASTPPKTSQSSNPEGATATKRLSKSMDQLSGSETNFPVELAEATLSTAVSSKTSSGSAESADFQKPAFTSVAGVPFTVPDSDVSSTKYPDALGKHRNSESTRASGSSSTDSSATISPASETSLSHEETSTQISVAKDAHAQSQTGSILGVSLSTSDTSLLKTATVSIAMEAGASKKAPSISWIFPILATFLS